MEWARGAVEEYARLRAFIFSVCHPNMAYRLVDSSSSNSSSHSWRSRPRYLTPPTLASSHFTPPTCSPWFEIRNVHAVKRRIAMFLCGSDYFCSPALRILREFVASVDRKLAEDKQRIFSNSEETKVLVSLARSQAEAAAYPTKRASTSKDDVYLMEIAALGNCTVFIGGGGR
jgi:hypothetical protein